MTGNTEHGLEEGQPEDMEDGTTVGSLSSRIRQTIAFVQSSASPKLFHANPNRWTQSIFCSTAFFPRKVPMILNSAVREGKGRVIKEAGIYR